ncbi:pnp [Symbiodinium natans]|uniref:Pnp protein n=1 Tax=Symbiodinium natans TaxID=878477 RepID=A0A812G537_9DINO|nr:pnp [Symbiodinium natans]
MGVDGKHFDPRQQTSLLMSGSKEVVDFGAFVEAEVPDQSEVLRGLVHISEIGDGYVESVSAVLQVDQEVDVRVKDIRTDGKVSLTMREPEVKAKKLQASSTRADLAEGTQKANEANVSSSTAQGVNQSIEESTRRAPLAALGADEWLPAVVKEVGPFGAKLEVTDPETSEAVYGWVHISEASDGLLVDQRVSDVLRAKQKVRARVLKAAEGDGDVNVSFSLRSAPEPLEPLELKTSLHGTVENVSLSGAFLRISQNGADIVGFLPSSEVDAARTGAEGCLSEGQEARADYEAHVRDNLETFVDDPLIIKIQLAPEPPCSREMAADVGLEELDDWLDDEDRQEIQQPEIPAAPRMPPGLEPPATTSGGNRLRSEEVPLEPPRLETPAPRWVCFRCESEQFSRDQDGWFCSVCSSRDFYNSSAPGRRLAPAGTWVYVPRADPEPNGFDASPGTPWRPSTLDGLSSTSPSAREARRPAGSFPWQEWAEGHRRETAESERATTDPTVDPDKIGALRKYSPEDSLEVTTLNKIEMLTAVAPGGERPKPGVKYRGGAPPQPPTWNYAREDVRAYDRYERKVRVWERQVSSFMPKNEAAMMLYVSLRGEAEEELEFMDMGEIDSPSGIENILQSLRRPLQTRAIYLKRKFLHDYEYLGRNNNESIRSFCNRYHRTEKSLLAARIDVNAMYDAESRGSRLLDRMRLTSEQQRLILVATGQSLHFDSIRESAQLQFPEHRATPPVAYHREFENVQHRTSGYPDGSQRGEDDMPGIPEEDDDDAQGDDDDEELVPQDDPENIEDVMREVADCLTVTARRLQGVTLGRKFSGGGRGKGLEQRKKNSHCMACGQKGHWQGDESCPVSAKGGRGSSASSSTTSLPKGDRRDKKGAAPKKVLTVFHPAGLDKSVSFESSSPVQDPEAEQEHEQTQEYGSYFTTFMTAFVGPPQEVFLSRPGDYAGFAVLDTACQRSLCSKTWLNSHREQLRSFKLDAKLRPENEGFQFGTGPIQISSEHAYFPTCLDGTLQTCSLFGASVMDGGSEIPLLLSLGMISKKLKAVLDFPKGVAYLGVFGVEVPIVKISGHVCLALNKFPKKHFAQWKSLSSVLDQGDPDVEFVTAPASETSPTHVHIAAATSMASEVAQNGADVPRRRDAAPALHGADGSPSTSTTLLAGAPGPDAPAVDRQLDQLPPDALRTSRGDAGSKRQSPRPVPKVLPVRNKVEMGARSVGRAALYTIAAAVASLSHIWSETGMGDPVVAGDGRAMLNGFFFGEPVGDWTDGKGQTFAALSAVGSDALQQAPAEEEQENEQIDDDLSDTYDWRCPFTRASNSLPKIDVLEIFAGTAGITMTARHYGLTALQPLDFVYGQDLNDKEQTNTLKNAVRQLRPLFLVCRWPHKNAGDAQLGNLDDLYNLGAWACREQCHHGRLFLGEHDPRGRFWQRECAASLLEIKDVHKTVCHAGAYGEEDEQGYPTTQQHQWISNSRAVLDRLGNKLTEEQLMYCQDQPTKSVHKKGYPCFGLISSVLKGVQEEARRRFPSRFQHKTFDVMYARPLNDPETWKQVLNEIEQRFSNTHKKPFNLNPGDPLREVLSQLVPWQLERVQAAWTPQSRRWPQDIPFTHRGAALMLTTGEVAIESEDLSQVTYPKQRFAKPIRVAVFFYGVYPVQCPSFACAAYTEEYQALQYDSAQYDSAQYASPALSPGLPATPLNAAPGTPDYTSLPLRQPPLEPGGHVTHNEHHDANDTDAQETQPNLAEQASASTRPAQAQAMETPEEELPTLPQKRPAAVLVTSRPLNFNYHDNGEVTLRDYQDDGGYNNIPFKRNYVYKCYLNSGVRKKEMNEAGVTEEPERSDESSDDNSMSTSNSRTHSRKELKQLDREIPWRQLTILPKPQLDAYLEATRVENDNWMSWGGIQPISHREAKCILGDAKLSRRILKSRAAYRDKSKGIGPLRPKCRVVIIGCADPDLFQITRDSPTPTRLSESLLMTIAAAGINKEYNYTGERWHLWASDAKSAFLQGDQDASERNGPLYMRPPRDPLIEATGSFPAELYLVTGNCYGLPNAPRVWYLRVHKTMLERGFKRHSFDRCLYYYVGDGNKLQAVVIIHVDDFLATYSESFPLHLLENMFVWGSITKVTTEEHAVYRGKEIRLHQEGSRFKYLVTQSEFIEGMEGGKIARGRGQQAANLTPSEWADFRSVSGSLQWIAGQTRPEIGPLVSLSNRGKATDYKDLQRLYEAVEFLKATPRDGLVYQDIALNKDSCFVTYTDSSFANAELKSQYGVLVFLSQVRVTAVITKGTLVDWKSARSARVCRSTLAAEASAADEGSDRAGFANLCLSELFTGHQALKAPPVFPNVQASGHELLVGCLCNIVPAHVVVQQATPVGLFAVLQPPGGGAAVKGFVHISELDEHVKADIAVGDSIRVRVLDASSGRLQLSMRHVRQP